ncbi:unnamed protein product [Urochloa humidicola]
MAFTDTAARKLLHGGAHGTIGQGIGEAGGIISFFVGILAPIFIALQGAAHLLVLFMKALWWWLHTFVSSAKGGINSGFFPGSFAHHFAALARAAHKIPQKLEELWRWLQAATTVALPFVLGVLAVLLLVALIWICRSTLCVVTVGTCKAITQAVASALSCMLPPCAKCLQCCAIVTMNAPGAASKLISHAAFIAAPGLYFQILHAAGPVVAAAVSIGA